jgi:hypothetical protein
VLEKLIRRLEKSGKIRKQKAGFVQIGGYASGVGICQLNDPSEERS